MDHLFRHESGKLVAVLTRVFGSDNLDLAEDVVQDSLAGALTQWQYRSLWGRALIANGFDCLRQK